MMSARFGQRKVSDLLFLTAVVVLSVAPYVARLGFYGDDWAFLGLLLNSPDQSLAGLCAAQFDAIEVIRQRPTQVVYQAVLFKAFGLNPLGYHLVNAAVLLSAAVLVYLVLREIEIHRVAAVSAAAIYVLLPSYSTARFWFAAFGYVLSTALFLLGMYAVLRGAHSQRLWAWSVLAVAALVVATLGIEVVLPLTLTIPVAVWLRSNGVFREGLRDRLGTSRTIVLMSIPVAVGVAVILYKARTAQGTDVPDVYYVMRLVVGSLAVNFGTYGVALPHTVAWSLPHLTIGDAAIGALLALLVVSYFWRCEVPPDSRRPWTRIVLAGIGVFILGTVMFVVTRRIAFWSTGVANRVWIAAALGTALMLAGAAGWASSHFAERFRCRVFAVLVTVLCVSSFVTDTALSGFWVAAWPRQRAVLDDIRRAVADIPSGTTLILTGVCPYVGPAIVFESRWDLAGALQVLYRDPSLQADVVVYSQDDRFSIRDDGLVMRLYGRSSFYRYGPKLLLFDYGRRTTLPLVDSGVARTHLVVPFDCEPAEEGRGTVMLPVDKWYHAAAAQGSAWRRSQ